LRERLSLLPEPAMIFKSNDAPQTALRERVICFTLHFRNRLGVAFARQSKARPGPGYPAARRLNGQGEASG